MSQRPPAIWLHLPPDPDGQVASDLCEALLDAEPSLDLVLTKIGPFPDGLADLGTLRELGSLAPEAARALLDEFRPAAVAWMDEAIPEPMLGQITARGVPAHLFDSGHLIDACREWQVWRRFVRSPFRHFRTITVGDETTARALMRNGARAGQIRLYGTLGRSPMAPPCSLAEFDEMAAAIGPRPMWLATDIHGREVGPILATHSQALRRSHRLLLILAPAEGNDADGTAKAIATAKLDMARRSQGQDPGPDTQVILADDPDEIGLWLRLAPVCFLGGTLAPEHGRPGLNPLAAATLGSAIVHGPITSTHVTEFARLHRAHAARQINHAAELAYTLEGLLSPERAAQMALSGWTVSTAQAEVIDRAVETLLHGLPGRQVPS